MENGGNFMAENKDRGSTGRLAGIVGIAVNAVLFTMKLIVGTLAGSVSITADALNNLSDASSSVVTLLGFKLAEKPADEDHPYGHARYEYLSGLAVAAMILFIGFELAKSSVEKIFDPQAVDFTWITAGVLVVSMAIKLWLSLFNRRLGKKINSDTLLATAADSRNDVIATGAVLTSGLVEHFTGLQVDGYMGLAVALFILYSGIGLAKDTISPLLGEAAGPELREQILDQIRSEKRVLGYHDLMVHDYGPGRRFASVHVEMDRREDPMLCHELIDDLERECYESHGIHLVIHYDPVVTDDPELERMRTTITRYLREVDSRLTMHDFRMVMGSGHTNLIFDVALPADMAGKKSEIKAYLDQKLNPNATCTYFTVITFDPEAFNR
jgi:cation diffusion facilitator family transporter